MIGIGGDCHGNVAKLRSDIQHQTVVVCKSMGKSNRKGGGVIKCIHELIDVHFMVIMMSMRCSRSLKNKSNRVQTTDAFSGELPAYLSLNRLLNGILCYS